VKSITLARFAVVVAILLPLAAAAQELQQVRAGNGAVPPAPVASVAIPLPADYVIGPEDSLSIVFWRERDLSGDVVVRSDGKISLPLLNDLQAAGFTPEQLRQRIAQEAARFVQDSTVTVVVRQINSRKVFITGQVARPGSYPLISPMTVMQLIALAGGLSEFADGNEITVVRIDPGAASGATTLRFKYDDVAKRKNLRQNVDLRPGDTVIVP
jgi:polysaccharide export outer membrane protein